MSIRRALALAALLAAPAFAGDLTPPPGPVAPTMKTLVDVEPRRAVNSLPGNAGALHLITQPGSYYLTGNIGPAGPGRFAIQVIGDGVTIDLNGFTIVGDTTETSPAISFGAIGEVKNGTIDNWGGTAIRSSSSCTIRDINFDFCSTTTQTLNLARGALVEGCNFRACGRLTFEADVLLRDCVFRDMAQAIDAPNAKAVTLIDVLIDGQNTQSTGHVLVLGDDARLSGVTVSNEGRGALLAGHGASVIGCSFSGNELGLNNGITVLNSATIRDNVIRGYGGDGIDADFGAVIDNNQISFCGDAGIVALVSAVITGNSVYANGGMGVFCSSGGHIEGNLVRTHGGDGIRVESDCRVVNNTLDGDPIHATQSDNVIDSNSVHDVSPAIVLDSGGNQVTRNTIDGTISTTGTNLIGVVRTSANFATAGPWDNFDLP